MFEMPESLIPPLISPHQNENETHICISEWEDETVEQQQHESVEIPCTSETDINPDTCVADETVASPTTTEVDALFTYSFKELRKLCRSEKLSQSGTKQEMVERLRKSALANSVIT